jgi:hypothetical protein
VSYWPFGSRAAPPAPRTRLAYQPVGERFLAAPDAATAICGHRGDVQAALEAVRKKEVGFRPATVPMKVCRGIAHRMGFTWFNAAPLIKLKARASLARSRSSC